MRKCIYNNGNCVLLGCFNIVLNAQKGKWCYDRCWPNHPPAQIAMLQKLGIVLPELPEGIDLLECAKRCVENGTVKVAQKQSGGGCCGAAKQIIKGFRELSKQKITGDDPPDFAVERIDICLKCEYRTFLRIDEWAFDTGIGVIKKKLLKIKKKDLPINHQQGRFDTLWCARCHCCIAAAALVPEKECAEDNWPSMKDSQYDV